MRIQKAPHRQTIRRTGLLSLQAIFLTARLMGSPSATQPDPFLAQVKHNVCWNFLKGPSPDLRCYTWRYEAVSHTLNSGREILKTRPYQLIEMYRTERGTRSRITVHYGDDVLFRENQPPVQGLTSPACWVSLTGCDGQGRDLKNIIWDLTEFSVVGKEILAGRPTRIYAFRTQPKMPERYRSDRRLKYFLKDAVSLKGRLWIDEQDYLPVRSEGKNYRTVPTSPLSRTTIRKGTSWKWGLKRSGEQWLPNFLITEIPYLDRFRRRVAQTLGQFDDFELIFPPGPKPLPVAAPGQAREPLQSGRFYSLQVTEPEPGANPFVGGWVNQNPNTRGVTKFRIRIADASFVVEMWGRCHPCDCYGGEVTAEYSEDPPRLAAAWGNPLWNEVQTLSFGEDGLLVLKGKRVAVSDSKHDDREYTEYFVRGTIE